MSSSEHMAWYNRLLFFSAGVHTALIRKCPRIEWIKYAGIGASVLFTALLAFLSSLFAFSLVTDYVAIAIFMALIWSAMIFNLDRFLVATIALNKRGMRRYGPYIPRFVLAFFIALVISRPIELKLFESEIDQHLAFQKNALIESTLAPLQKQVQERDTRIAILEKRLSDAFERKEAYYEDYKCECDGTCGTGIRGRGSECARKEAKYLAFLDEYELLRMDMQERTEALRTEQQTLLARMDEERMAVNESFSTGLLARLDALSRISSLSSLAILGLFLLIEIGPLLTKMLAGGGPYENLLIEELARHKTSHKSTMHSLNQELLTQKKITDLDADYRVKLKKEDIKEQTKRRVLDRHQQNRNTLGHKLTDQ